MKVLVVGGGGREHALAWKLAQSAQCEKLFAAPGNPGIAQYAECLALDATDHGPEDIAAVLFCTCTSTRLIPSVATWLSGELGIDYATNALVPGGAGPETTQIFANMEQTLAHYDADLSDIVKCTVFLDDMSKFGEMNAAYTAALPDPKPARSTFGADGLALGAALEIECIAVK